MDAVTVADLRTVERAVSARMVEVFGLDLAGRSRWPGANGQTIGRICA